MKFRKCIKILLTATSIGLIATTVSAQEKMSTYVELSRAVGLCFDLATSGKDKFASLSQNGYRIKKKRKYTAYKKGVSFHLFGAAGIDIFKYPSGCTINGRGISEAKANRVYKTLQARLASVGYLGAGGYYKKGAQIIKMKGKYLIQGSTAVLSIHQEN